MAAVLMATVRAAMPWRISDQGFAPSGWTGSGVRRTGPIRQARLDNYVSYDLPLAMAYGSALAVLADPTRRKVFERLRAGPRAVNLIAAGLPVSRPAVSQHLKVLKAAGLVEERSEGVRRIYSLRREGLLELRQWLDSFWGDALEAFKLEAEKSHKTRRNK
jgi:DNA-binding transcriptional ArsR family regulator